MCSRAIPNATLELMRLRYERGMVVTDVSGHQLGESYDSLVKSGYHYIGLPYPLKFVYTTEFGRIYRLK